MKPIVAFVFVLFLFAGCGAPLLPPYDVGDGGIVVVASALALGSPLCFTPGGDPNAVMPAQASYPIGNQHIYCQEQVGETNTFQWPAWATGCAGLPGLHQLDVFVSDTSGTGPGTFCTRVTIPFGGVTLMAAYIDTLKLGWLASRTLAPGFVPGSRYVDHMVLGRGTDFTASSQQDVNATGCASMACVQGVVTPYGQVTTFPIHGAGSPQPLTTYSWAMGTNGPPTCTPIAGFVLDPPVACPGFTHCMSCAQHGIGGTGTIAGCVSATVNTLCAASCSECFEP